MSDTLTSRASARRISALLRQLATTLKKIEAALKEGQT